MGRPKTRVNNVLARGHSPRATGSRIRGPLAPIAEDFRASLREAGYTPLTSVNKLRSLAYLEFIAESVT